MGSLFVDRLAGGARHVTPALAGRQRALAVTAGWAVAAGGGGTEWAGDGVGVDAGVAAAPGEGDGADGAAAAEGGAVGDVPSYGISHTKPKPPIKEGAKRNEQPRAYSRSTKNLALGRDQ